MKVGSPRVAWLTGPKSFQIENSRSQLIQTPFFFDVLGEAVSVGCSLGGPLLYGPPVAVFPDRGHPCFCNYYSAVPVDVRINKTMKKSVYA